jgi:recombinational DNA repair ATPase RecF
VRSEASAGERKAAGLLLAAAQGEVCVGSGRRPIYLLDDFDAELDGGRVAALWRLFAPAGQVVATTSRPEVWEALGPPLRWALEGGEVGPAAGR